MYCCANLSHMYRKGDGKLLNVWYLFSFNFFTGIKQDFELAEKYKKLAMEMQNEWQMNKSVDFQQGIQQ